MKPSPGRVRPALPAVSQSRCQPRACVPVTPEATRSLSRGSSRVVLELAWLPAMGAAPRRAQAGPGAYSLLAPDRAGGGTLGPHRQALHRPGHATKALPPLGSPGRAHSLGRGREEGACVHRWPTEPSAGLALWPRVPTTHPSRGQGDGAAPQQWGPDSTAPTGGRSCLTALRGSGPAKSLTSCWRA